MRIVLGIQEDEDELDFDTMQRKPSIQLHDTDRFIFELKDVQMLTQMEQETQEIKVDMGIQKIEIREEFKDVPDELEAPNQSEFDKREDFG